MNFQILVLFFIHVKFGSCWREEIIPYFGDSQEEKLNSPLFDVLKVKNGKTMPSDNFIPMRQKLFEDKLKHMV